MSGGIPLITLPAGYLGSSFLGACMIACGFNTNASKIATLVLAAVFVLALFWARRNVLWVVIVAISLHTIHLTLYTYLCFWIQAPTDTFLCRTWVLILGFVGLILLFWFVKGSVALRYFVLFMGVMSCMYGEFSSSPFVGFVFRPGISIPTLDILTVQLSFPFTGIFSFHTCMCYLSLGHTLEPRPFANITHITYLQWSGTLSMTRSLGRCVFPLFTVDRESNHVLIPYMTPLTSQILSFPIYTLRCTPWRQCETLLFGMSGIVYIGQY